MVLTSEKKINEQMLFDNAPVESDDYETEAQILDAQVKKQDVTNIGVVATYGAGKSSAINTYLKRYRKKGLRKPKHVQISLADFNKDENDANPDNNNYSENAIERSILQQLFYSQRKYKLPKSSINRTNKTSFWLTAGCALLSIIFILSVIVLSFEISGNSLFNVSNSSIINTIANQLIEKYNIYTEDLTVDGVVDLPSNMIYIGDTAFSGTTSLNDLHISSNVSTVGAAVLANWDSSKQNVYVHNVYVLPEYDSATGMGWHPQWASNFTNINYDKEFFTLTLDAGEGEIVEENENGDITYKSVKKIVVEYKKEIGELPTPTRDGYAFRGWEYDSEYKNVIGKDFADTKHTLEAKQNLTVKAVWWPVFTVTLKSEDGNETYGSVKVEYMGEFKETGITDETLAIPSRKGYLLSFDLNGISYLTLDKRENKLKSANVWNVQRDDSIYATWKPIEYTVIYDADFKGHDNSNKKIFRIDKDVSYRFLTITDVDLHERLSWEYKYFGDMDLDKANADNTIILKGFWVEIKTIISYNLNGGEFKHGEYPTSIKYSESKKIGEPYRYSYAFEGWYVNNVEGEKLYKSNLTKRTEEELVLVAKWGYRAGSSKIIQIPNNVSEYKITINGSYKMPSTYSGNLSIIIEPSATKVHLLNKATLTRYYNTTITIKAYKYGQCSLYLENLYIKAPAGQAAIYMCYVDSSSSSSGSSIVPNNPYVTPVVPPITGPTFPIIKPTGANYSQASTYDIGFAKEMSGLNLFAYGKVEIHGGNSDISRMNAGCAIFCENLHIRHADNLLIRGGDAEGGDAGYGIMAIYSVNLDDYDVDFNYSNNYVEVLGGDKIEDVIVGSFILKQKTPTKPICILHAS